MILSVCLYIGISSLVVDERNTVLRHNPRFPAHSAPPTPVAFLATSKGTVHLHRCSSVLKIKELPSLNVSGARQSHVIEPVDVEEEKGGLDRQEEEDDEKKEEREEEVPMEDEKVLSPSRFDRNIAEDINNVHYEMTCVAKLISHQFVELDAYRTEFQRQMAGIGNLFHCFFVSTHRM